MTFPAVAPQAPIDENFERESPSAQTELHRRTTVGAWQSLSQRVESAKCYAALFPRIGDETYSKLQYAPNPGGGYPRAAFRRPTYWGRASDPNRSYVAAQLVKPPALPGDIYSETDGPLGPRLLSTDELSFDLVNGMIC